MALLSVDRVGKTHRVGPYDKSVLTDVSLTLDRGDFYGVWGAQRSGKSTLLRLAAGLELPDTGSVSFDGVDLAGLSKERRTALRLHDIGLVLGDGPQRRTMTVLDFVALPLFSTYTRREARCRAFDALRRTDVVECAAARWDQLSDGETTLVSLAHGLVRRPRLLLVDDPTARLDALRQAEFIDLLRNVAAGQRMAVLMVSAVLGPVVMADEAFTLSDGRLVPVSDGERQVADVIEFPRSRQRRV